jgi:murein L,D-transpeptidase YafK
VQSTAAAVAAGDAFASTGSVSTGSVVSAPPAEAATQGVGSGSGAVLESAAPGGAAPDMTPEASVSSAASATTAPAGFTSISSAVSTSAAGSAEPVPSPVEASAVAPRERADRILVKKGERKLYLLRADDVIAEYPIRLGLNPYGPKQREGDFRTPEGVYHLSRRNPDSNFYLSLEVSYPNFADRARAHATGVPPGGLIMIHGQPNLLRKPADYYASNDWTDGCIAVSNADMRDIWMRTDVGIPIEIRP